MPGDPLDDLIEKACDADPRPPIEEGEPIPGTPLSAAEIARERSRLADWQSSDAFITTTNALRTRCRPSDFVNRPELKFLSDAFVLAEFVRLSSVDAVRLARADEQWPDGMIKSSGKQHNVEVTSTHGGRLLGKEYRTTSKPRLDPVTNWIARADSILKYLDDAISKKFKKRYSLPCWLVVYLNINEHDIRQSETEKVIADTKSRYGHSFEAIFVLWKRRIY
jgi:hypothetical protein